MTTFTTEDREQAEPKKEPHTFWNHRVVQSINEFDEVWFEVCEVYYNNKGEPCGYCNGYVGGETMVELSEQLARLKHATSLPVLNATTDFNNDWGNNEKEL